MRRIIFIIIQNEFEKLTRFFKKKQIDVKKIEKSN